ncbi:uncharacterized protein MELLADRAFT_118019 [Melampsora larici-populina 98AG31]|uniref:Uncharacterized protein n=1 Tax=Melampsora larici-populina (strain 98AG31 / pathotype 3-4-7) TaxID=747676 RepID=F4S466_MELLP|nr:uncharacterized protein MELLADRAFT_118019 [Melampsora larici-populina 98AG31]EGG00530.1 hypothetical protein MELLADRAFT_118019 [Melampsora larici-populina 98AG31]
MNLSAFIHRNTFFLIPESKHARAFLLVTIIESFINITLEAIIIGRTDLLKSLLDAKARTPLAVYLAIFILAHLFQLFLAHDALRQKNTIQLIGLCWFNLAFLVYAVIQVPEIKEIEEVGKQTTPNEDPSNGSSTILLLAIPAVITISELGFIYLLWYLFREFGWQVYKQIGADRRLKRMYFIYQIFICVLKFDYFFFFAFSLQLVLLVPSVSNLEKILTIIALPLTLVLLVLGYISVRKESDWSMVSFQIGLVSGAGYFVYKLFRIWQGRDDPLSYQSVFKSLTVFSVSCLLYAIVTSIIGIICYRNFGNGLKTSMNRRKNGENLDSLGMHYNLDSTSTIDQSKSNKSSSKLHLPRRHHDPNSAAGNGAVEWSANRMSID